MEDDMKYPQAIIMGAALIAAAIFFTSGAPIAEAQRTGPWQMHVGSGPGIGSAVAWRINTVTGEMHACFGHQKAPSCSKMPLP